MRIETAQRIGGIISASRTYRIIGHRLAANGNACAGIQHQLIAEDVLDGCGQIGTCGAGAGNSNGVANGKTGSGRNIEQLAPLVISMLPVREPDVAAGELTNTVCPTTVALTTVFSASVFGCGINTSDRGGQSAAADPGIGNADGVAHCIAGHTAHRNGGRTRTGGTGSGRCCRSRHR